MYNYVNLEPVILNNTIFQHRGCHFNNYKAVYMYIEASFFFKAERLFLIVFVRLFSLCFGLGTIIMLRALYFSLPECL